MLCIGLWLAKINATVLNRAILKTFYSPKKVKIDSKDINYRFLFTWEAVVNRAIHDTFFKSQTSRKKRIYGNYGSIFACDIKKCPGLLYLPLLEICYSHISYLFSIVTNSLKRHNHNITCFDTITNFKWH